MNKLPNTVSGFIWHLTKSYKRFFLGFLFIGLLWSIQFSGAPYLLKLIIDRIADYQGDKANISSVIKIPVILYILSWVVMAFNFRIADYIKLRVFPQIRSDIINNMFSYVSLHSHRYLQNNFAGSISNKIMDMAGSTASIFTRLDEIIANTFAFFIALFAMYFVNPIFSLMLLIWCCLFMSITLFFSKKTKFLSQVFSESKSTLSGRIVDAVTNLTNIRLFASNHFENNRLNITVTDSVVKDRNVQMYILKMKFFWDVTFIILLSSMLSGLVVLYSQNKITVGDFTFIMTLAINVFMHVWFMAGQFVQFAEEIGKCAQALTIISAPHEVVDKPDARPLVVNKGNIIFNDVTFHYHHKHGLFRNKHVEIAGGSKVGLVGFSGSGKTTFVNLILRFYDLEAGQILIDNQDIAGVTQDSLHKQISMIPQDTSLFHRTLMENIAYGNTDASYDEIIQASKKAHCDEFINKLPEGYESLVGERGIKLSGGQRQRIAIARAILKNAPILILDEATSALDSVTEKYIQEGLQNLMDNRTTIVIAHRLSTLSSMDRILVFDNGTIIEDGHHEQLLKNNGHYAMMWEMQAGGFLPEDRDTL